jgi:D-alanyl-D-alanine carboxypeptidase
MTLFPHRSAPIGALCAVLAALMSGPAAGQTKMTEADLQRGLEQLVGAKGGPPGVIVTLYSDGRMTVLRAGRADVEHSGAPRVNDHMRIASIAKAFNGAVALRLVSEGRLSLADTIGQRLPSLLLRLSRRAP